MGARTDPRLGPLFGGSGRPTSGDRRGLFLGLLVFVLMVYTVVEVGVVVKFILTVNLFDAGRELDGLAGH